MSKRIVISLANSCLIVLILVQYFSLTSGSKKNFKDHGNQMEPVHSVRHMARLMRRMLAEESDSEANGTMALPSSSESPTVTTVTSTTTAPLSTSTSSSSISSAETISQMYKEVKHVNQTISARTSFHNGNYGNKCPAYLPCDVLNVECMVCIYNISCIYGEDVSASCEVKDSTRCQGKRKFERRMNCRYCYQTPSIQHTCEPNVTCRVISSPQQRVRTKCKVLPNVLCLGNREFNKNSLCNWSKGYSWTTTLTLSVVLGGFGVDRFYLGMWQEGIGKLFSFGGLGVWTLVDVILIATGYLGPADGSLYIL